MGILLPRVGKQERRLAGDFSRGVCWVHAKMRGEGGERRLAEFVGDSQKTSPPCIITED